jgi:hypothetical protein
MSTTIDLQMLKKHLNIEEDFTEDDSYLEILSNAAVNVVENYLVDNLELIAEDNGGELPSSLSLAIFIMVADWYAYRESVTNLSVNKLPQSLMFILNQFKCYDKATRKERREKEQQEEDNTDDGESEVIDENENNGEENENEG